MNAIFEELTRTYNVIFWLSFRPTYVISGHLDFLTQKKFRTMPSAFGWEGEGGWKATISCTNLALQWNKADCFGLNVPLTMWVPRTRQLVLAKFYFKLLTLLLVTATQSLKRQGEDSLGRRESDASEREKLKSIRRNVKKKLVMSSLTTSSTLSYNQEQLPYPGQVLLLVRPGRQAESHLYLFTNLV